MTASPRVRLDPATRREQLLALGVQLLATRSLEDISIEALSEEAGISRGLLYHYFGNKQDFHRAVVRRAADDLIAVTAPQEGLSDPIQALELSLAAYVDYVIGNYTGYLSLIRSAAGGDEEIHQIYESARQALTDRIFELAGAERLAEVGVTDNPATRMLAHGWAALVEDTVLSWVRDPRGMERAELLRVLAGALPAVLVQTRS